MSAERKFVNWLHVQIFSKKDEGACSKVVVRHQAGKGSEDVGYLKMPKPETIREEETEEQIQLLADQLWDMAENDAKGIVAPTLQTYSFQAWFEGELTKPLSRCTARFATSNDEDIDGSGDMTVSEAPNGTGLVSQAMRHAEAFAKIATMASTHQLSMQQRTIDSQQGLIAKLVEEKLDSINLIEDLQSKKQERALELREKEESFKLRTDAMESLKTYFPLVAKKLFGQKALPAGDGKSTPMVKQLLSSVTAEQWEQMQGVLRPEQIAILADMMMEQQEEETKKPATEGAEQPH